MGGLARRFAELQVTIRSGISSASLRRPRNAEPRASTEEAVCGEALEAEPSILMALSRIVIGLRWQRYLLTDWYAQTGGQLKSLALKAPSVRQLRG